MSSDLPNPEYGTACEAAGHSRLPDDIPPFQNQPLQASFQPDGSAPQSLPVPKPLFRPQFFSFFPFPLHTHLFHCLVSAYDHLVQLKEKQKQENTIWGS